VSTTRQHIEVERLTRTADVRAASLDREARTVEVVISTGAMVRRRGWFDDYDEAIPVDRAALERINTIGVVLDNHRSWGSVADTLGAVEPGSVRVEGEQLVGRLRFARTTRGDEVLGLIEDGILRAVSVGYDVDEYEQIKPKDRKDGVDRTLVIPTRWEPYEVSVVQMPADAGATVRAEGAPEIRRYAVRSTEETTIMAETTQTQQAPAPDARAIAKRMLERLRHFETIAVSQGVDVDKVRDLVAEHADDGPVGLAILEMARKRQAEDKITGPQPPAQTGRAEAVRDGADKLFEAMRVGVVSRAAMSADPGKVQRSNEKLRATGRATEAVPELGTDELPKRFARMRLIDVAEQFLESRGVRCGHMSQRQIAEAALAYRGGGGQLGITTDFSYLLADSANKMVAVGYSEVTSPWRNFARRMDRPDFRQFTIVRRSGAPSLEVVNEHGELKRAGYLDTTPFVGRRATAGIEVGFTRQMLINDELDQFAQQSLGLGDSAVRFEDDSIVIDMLYGNPLLNDSVAIFDAARGNISADVGTPDMAAVIAVAKLFSQMTETIKKAGNNAGTTTRKLQFRLRGFLAALSEKMTLDQVCNLPIVPALGSSTRPEEVSMLPTWRDDRLGIEASGPDVWFGVADRTPIVYGGLQGDPSPRLSSVPATGTDGIVWQFVHDWYGAIEEPRALVRVPKS